MEQTIEQTKTGRRVAKWDNARGVLIILVVLGHVVEPVVNAGKGLNWLFFLIYLFHMPAFFFLSGVVSKNTVKNRRYDRAVGYLFLYFVMKGIIFLVRSALHHKDAVFLVLEEKSIPWFAFCMFVFLLVSILLREIKWQYVLAGSVLLACFAGYDSSIGDFLVLSRILVYYPFFYAGLCISGEKLQKAADTTVLRIAGGVILFLVFLVVLNCCEDVYWLRPLITGRNPYSALSKYSRMGGGIRLLYYAVVGILVFSFLAMMPSGDTFLCRLGEKTLSVYALHMPVLYLSNIFKLKDRFLNWSIFPTRLIPCLIWVIPIVFLCTRKLPVWFFRKVMDVRRTADGS